MPECNTCHRDLPQSEFHPRYRFCKDCSSVRYGRPRRVREVWPVGYRRCKICKQLLSADHFWKAPTTFDRLHIYCIDCTREKYGYKAKVKSEPAPEGFKRCPSCKNAYPSDAEHFPRSKNKLGVYCLKCHSKKGQNWMKAHPNIRRAGQRRRYPSIREKAIKYRREWAMRNPEKVTQYSGKRRALKRHVDAEFTSADRARCIGYFRGCCAVCGRPRGLWNTIAMDHWIPLSKGGAHKYDNIVPLCHATKDGGNECCNNSKLNKDAYTWLCDKYGRRKANQIMKRIEAYFEWVKDHHASDATGLI